MDAVWPPNKYGLSAYIAQVWRNDGRKVCHLCGKPVLYDIDCGYWIHAGFGKVDGHNGLFCSPEEWEKPYRERLYPNGVDEWSMVSFKSFGP